MDILNFTETRARLKEVMDGVVRDHAPVVVDRPKGGDVVIVSREDWEGMEETIHLLSFSANAKRLRASIAKLDAGGGQMREIVDP